MEGAESVSKGHMGDPICLPVAPAGGTRGSELELGTFTRKSRTRCASLSPAVSGQKSCFLTETAVSGVLFLTVNASVSGVLFLTVNASGVQKVLDRNHGVETHRARRALKRGNFFHEQVFFSQKTSFVFTKNIFNDKNGQYFEHFF